MKRCDEWQAARKGKPKAKARPQRKASR
jgi:hypothetical protein